MKLSFISIFVLTFLAVPFLVLAVPGIPHQFYGSVSFSNGPAPDGVLVEAKIAGTSVATTATLNGKYGYNPNLFFVTDPDNNRTGKTITFFVGGLDTGKTALFENGEHTELNFSISGNIGIISKGANETIENQSLTISPTIPGVIKMGDELSITITSTASTTATIEKVQKLESNFFTGTTAVLAGQNVLNAFEIKITGNVTITVTMSYSDTGIDESTVMPYKFDGTTWVVITPYIRNEATNTLTFEIQAETPYVVFGSPPTPPSPPSPPPADTTAPSISEIKVVSNTDEATITWKTDEPSISWVVFGTSTAYGIEAKTTNYITSHSVNLLNLSPSTTYHYQVKCKDTTGNIGSSGDKTFTTLAPAGGGGGGGGGVADTTAPSISEIKVVSNTDEATITWKTDELSISWIVYGTSTTYGKEVKMTNSTTSHSVTLLNLSPLTTYHYQIKSRDATGNVGSSGDKTFTSLAIGEITKGDINKDNKVDKYDFALLMANWGKTGTNTSDLNNDGKVDKYDFALLMANWSTA